MNYKKITIIIIVLSIAISLSVINGAKQKQGTDFHTFWNAGYSFFHNQSLYSLQVGSRDFIYLPFAAMCFGLFSLLPLKVSGSIFYFINILLWFFSIYLTKHIFDFFYPGKIKKKQLIFAAIFSSRFFLNNINLLQINEVVFILCLLGIYFFVNKKELLSGVFFTIATFIKIVPIFFLGWLFVRAGKKIKFSIITSCIVCLLLPIFFRGFNRGVHDLQEYSNSFLNSFISGKVITQYTNQNFSSALYRLTQPSDNNENLNYQVLHLSENITRSLYKISVLLIFLLFFTFAFISRLKNYPITAFEITNVFLVSHLLSGITWKAHLVSFLFVYMSFFSIRKETLSQGKKRFLIFINSLLIVIGITSRGIVGKTLHYYLGGFSLITWTMVILIPVSIYFHFYYSAHKE